MLTVNMDIETGIHYGVINQHKLGEGASQDLCSYPDWNNDSYDNAVEKAKSEFKTLVLLIQDDILAELKEHEIKDNAKSQLKLFNFIENLRDSIDELVTSVISFNPTFLTLDDLFDDFSDKIMENFESGGGDNYSYDKEDYELSYSSDSGDIFVIKSKYFTFANQCSPCAPNAGYITSAGSMPSYCLRADWFDDEEKSFNGHVYTQLLPYDIYLVEDMIKLANQGIVATTENLTPINKKVVDNE